MKKIIIALGALIVVMMVAFLALPALVPADRIKSEVVAQVKAATGRDLTIDGKVSVSAFPTLGVEVADVALSNPPGYSTKTMVRLGALDVKLKVLPLLGGKVEVDSFVLVDPVVALEVDRHGRPNWVFGETKPEAKAKEKGASATPPALADLRLGQVAIRNGKLTYADGATREEVSNVNLTVNLPSLDDPLSVNGSADWHGQTVNLAVDAGEPRALVDGGTSPFQATVASKTVSLTFKGQASGKGAANGDMDLSIPSIRTLVQWATGKPLDAPGTGLQTFSLKGKLDAAGSKVALEKASIQLDAIRADGDLSVDTGGARPAIKGRLAVDTLDVNAYLPPEEKQSQGQQKATQQAGAGDWSDQPIDASGLKGADVDFALAVGAIKVRAIEIGKSALHLTLVNGRAVADLTEMELYKGSGRARIAIDGSQPGIGLDATASLKNLQAEPFLQAAAGFDRIEGTAGTELALSGRGRTERQLIGSLDGKGQVAFLDGAIKGVNLAAMARNVTSAFTDTGGEQKTDFAELGGTWTMSQGVMTNRDLALKSPLLRVEGAGTVDLPHRSLRYRIDPKAVASLEGQGGKGDLSGVTVPVIVEGPWSNLTFRPDLESMVKGQAENAVKGLLGGQPAGSGDTGTKPALPLNLPGLFGK